MSDTSADALDSIRRDVLAAALTHIPFDGWSGISLGKAARDIGVDAGAVGMAFPAGAADLLDFFAQDADSRMLARVAEQGIGDMRMRDRIRTVVKTRIDVIAEHREAERRALSFAALPQNAALGLKTLARSVDLMWRAAGDTSTDFAFYTKRATLAAVYSATVMYWIGDSSEGNADTWAFLDRRIENVMTVEKTKLKLRKTLQQGPSLAALLSRLRYPGESRMKP
ncbi:COQ9 family protein [Emcibacter sp. SYSU 3D8]|uniref:COQ9 family protein n=1 Tax=Emcibacter sp. SYSU 3D8 TaxID=3133969 RepID=UPI0031FF0862